MYRRLKSDLLRTGLLVMSLITFPLITQPAPPPEGLKIVGDLQVTPLNVYLSERYYGLAVTALKDGDVSLNKSFVTAAIHFDPQAFSVRYSEYKRARDEVLHL